MSCIHSASLEGHYHMVESLLLNTDSVVDVNLQDSDGDTPLNLAAKMGFVNIVELLIKNGADQRLKNKDGLTAVLSAMVESRVPVVTYLLRAGGSSVNIINAGDNVVHVSEYDFIHLSKMNLFT